MFGCISSPSTVAAKWDPSGPRWSDWRLDSWMLLTSGNDAPSIRSELWHTKHSLHTKHSQLLAMTSARHSQLLVMNSLAGSPDIRCPLEYCNRKRRVTCTYFIVTIFCLTNKYFFLKIGFLFWWESWVGDRGYVGRLAGVVSMQHRFSIQIIYFDV